MAKTKKPAKKAAKAKPAKQAKATAKPAKPSKKTKATAKPAKKATAKAKTTAKPAKKVASAKPVQKVAKTTTAARVARLAPPAPASSTPGWVDAGKSLELAIRDGKLVARKQGKELASVPKAAKDSAVGERLASAIDFLEDHERTCRHTVETWMLRSLPVPRAVLQAVLPDPVWAATLRDVWVVAVAPDGTVDREVGGFFRGVDPDKGIGVVDRDGETTWLSTESVLIPHPILLDELEDLRAMAVEIDASQGTSQLFRETFANTPPAPGANTDAMAIDRFAGGEFAMLQGVIGLAKRLGYRVSGGAAVCRVLERGRTIDARYDLGDGDGMDSTTTGDLTWVDDKQRTIALANVPPVAFSEGMRMAAQIYAKRKVDKEDSDD